MAEKPQNGPIQFRPYAPIESQLEDMRKTWKEEYGVEMNMNWFLNAAVAAQCGIPLESIAKYKREKG